MNVRKVDLDVAILYIFYTHVQVFYLDITFLMRDLNVPYNMKHMLLRVFFFIINSWLITFFNIFFDVAKSD